MNNAEYKLFKRALVTSFSINEFDRFLQDRLGEDRETIIGAGNKKEIVSAVAAKAKRDNWLPKLLFHAHLARPNNANLKALLNRSGSPSAKKRWPDWYAPASVFYSCFIGESDMFIDRDPVRQMLENISNGQGERTVLIDGPPSAGKTYSAGYISFVKQTEGGFKLGQVDFEKWSPRQLKPMQLIEELLTQGDSRQIKFDAFAQGARQGEKMVEDLLEFLAKEQSPWVITFDHLPKTTLAQDTEDFIKEFVRQNVARPSSNVHIIILGKPEYLNPSDPLDLPLEIQRTELEQYFDELIKGRAETATPAGLNFLVNTTKDTLGGTLDKPIAEVAEAVQTTCEMVF